MDQLTPEEQPDPPLPVPNITKTIGTSGRDYSTIASWEADLDNGAIYASGDTAVGECYNDSTFSISAGITINGGGTVGLAGVILQAASGQRHDGTAGTGVRIIASAAITMFTLSRGSLNVRWLVIDCNKTGIHGVDFGSLGAITGQTIENCIVCRVKRADTVHGIYHRPGDGIDSCILNTQVFNCDNTNTGSTLCYGIRSTGVRATSVLNCTVHNIKKGGSSGTCIGIQPSNNADHTSKNNISTDPSGGATVNCFGTAASAVQSNNLSSDTTATGSGSLTSKSSSTQFVSTTVDSEDLHLKAGADAINAGTDLGTTPTNVQYDTDGRDRDSNADTWDIGADEYVSAASGSLLLNNGLNAALLAR